MGADDAIDHTKETFTRLGRRRDRILDVSASRSLFELRRSLTPDGSTWMGGMIGTIRDEMVAPAAHHSPHGGSAVRDGDFPL